MKSESFQPFRDFPVTGGCCRDVFAGYFNPGDAGMNSEPDVVDGGDELADQIFAVDCLPNQILCQEGTILKTGCHAGDGRFFRTFQMELRSHAADFRFGNAELGKR